MREVVQETKTKVILNFPLALDYYLIRVSRSSFIIDTVSSSSSQWPKFMKKLDWWIKYMLHGTEVTNMEWDSLLSLLTAPVVIGSPLSKNLAIASKTWRFMSVQSTSSSVCQKISKFVVWPTYTWQQNPLIHRVYLKLTLVTVMKSGPKNTLFTPSILNRSLQLVIEREK